METLQDGIQEDRITTELQNEANDEGIELDTDRDIATETSYIALKSRGSSLVLQLWQKNIADGEYELIKLLYKGVTNRKINDDDSPWARNSIYLVHGSNSLSDQSTVGFLVYNGLLGSHTGHHQPLVKVPYKEKDGTITYREVPATNTPVHVISSMDEYLSGVKALMENSYDDNDPRTDIQKKWQRFWNKIKNNPNQHLMPLIDEFDTERGGNKPFLHRPDPIALILAYAAITSNLFLATPLTPTNGAEYTDLLNAITLLYYAWNEIDYKTLNQQPQNLEHTSIIIAIDRTIEQLENIKQPEDIEQKDKIITLLQNLRADLIKTITSDTAQETELMQIQQILNTLAWYSMASDISRQYYLFGFFIRPPILRSSSWMPTPITMGLTFWIEPPSLLFISATQGDNDGDYARIAIAAPLMGEDIANAATILTAPVQVIERTYTQNLFQGEEPDFNQAPATDAAATHGQIFLTAASNLPYKRDTIPVADLSEENIEAWTIGTIKIFERRKTFVGFEWKDQGGTQQYQPQFFKAESAPFARREISYLSPHKDELPKIQSALRLTKRPPVGFHDTSWLDPQSNQTESPFEYYGTIVQVKRGNTTYYTTLAHLTYLLQTIAYIDELENADTNAIIDAIIKAAATVGWLQPNGNTNPETITPLSREKLTEFYTTLDTNARYAAISSIESTRSAYNQPRVYDPEHYIKSAKFPPIPTSLDKFATVAKDTTKLTSAEKRIASTTLDAIIVSCLHFATALRAEQTKLIQENALPNYYTITQLLEEPTRAINPNTETDAHTMFSLYYEPLDDEIKNDLYKNLSDEDRTTLTAYFIPYDATVTIDNKTYEVGIVVDNITNFPYVLMIERNEQNNITQLYTTFSLYTLTHQNPNNPTHKDPTEMTNYNPIEYQFENGKQKALATLHSIQTNSKPIHLQNQDFALQTLSLLIPPSDETLNRPDYSTLRFDPKAWYSDLEYQMTLKPFGFMLNMSFGQALAIHYDLLATTDNATAMMISPGVFTVLQMINPYRTNAANTKRLMNAITKATTLGTEIEYVEMETTGEKRILIGHAKNEPLPLKRLQTLLTTKTRQTANATSIKRKRNLKSMGTTSLSDPISADVQHYVGLLSNALRRANYDPQTVADIDDCSKSNPNRYSPAVIPLAHLHLEVDLTASTIDLPETLTRTIKENSELARGLHMHAIPINTKQFIELPKSLGKEVQTEIDLGEKWKIEGNKLIPKQNLWIIGTLEITYTKDGTVNGLLYPIAIPAETYTALIQQHQQPAIGYDEEINSIFEKAVKSAAKETQELIKTFGAQKQEIENIEVDTTEKTYTYTNATERDRYPFPIARRRYNEAYPLAFEAYSEIEITINKGDRIVKLEATSTKHMFDKIYQEGATNEQSLAPLSLAIAATLISNPELLDIIEKIINLPEDHEVVKAFGRNFVYVNPNDNYLGVEVKWSYNQEGRLIPTFIGKNVYGQLVTQIGKNLLINPQETLKRIKQLLKDQNLLSRAITIQEGNEQIAITIEEIIDALIDKSEESSHLHLLSANIFARTPTRCQLSRPSVYATRQAIPIKSAEQSQTTKPAEDAASPAEEQTSEPNPQLICKACAGRKSNKQAYQAGEEIEYDRTIAQNMVDAPKALPFGQSKLDESRTIEGQHITRSTIDPSQELQERAIISVYQTMVQSAMSKTKKSVRELPTIIREIDNEANKQIQNRRGTTKKKEMLRLVQDDYISTYKRRKTRIFIPQGNANPETLQQILKAAYLATTWREKRDLALSKTKTEGEIKPIVEIRFVVESEEDAKAIKNSIMAVIGEIEKNRGEYQISIKIDDSQERINVLLPFQDVVRVTIEKLRPSPQPTQTSQTQQERRPIQQPQPSDTKTSMRDSIENPYFRRYYEETIYDEVSSQSMDIEELLKTIFRVNPDDTTSAGIDLHTAYAMLISDAILYDSITMDPERFEHARNIEAVARKVGTPILYYEPSGTPNAGKLSGLGEPGNLRLYPDKDHELIKNILIVDTLIDHDLSKNEPSMANKILKRHMIETTRRAIKAALWGQGRLATITSMLHLISALQRYVLYDPRTRTTKPKRPEEPDTISIGDIPQKALWVIGHEPRIGEGRTPGSMATLTPPTPRP